MVYGPPIRAHGFTENFVAEQADGGFAGWQAMAGQQVGDGTIGGALSPQFNDDVLCRDQFLEFLRPARSKFLDRLADFIGIKCGHKMGMILDLARHQDGDGMEINCNGADIHRPIVNRGQCLDTA